MLIGHRSAERVRRHLDVDEVIVTSLVGVEHDGRRRRAVTVTDRRICVTWLRGGPLLELELGDATCAYERRTGSLILRQGDHEVVLRVDDRVRARALVELLTHHRHGALEAARSKKSLRLVSS